MAAVDSGIESNEHTMPLETIYVKLIGESVPVWRPVRAEQTDDDSYLIVEQPYDREIEQWEFQPGDRVVCESITLSYGPTLAAVRRAT